MRKTLLAFPADNGVDPGKYHETLTRAWIPAVHYFRSRMDDALADEFIDNNTAIFDSKIMMTHYSDARLFSDDARRAFVE